jgi:PAS domain S-box-containing protein
MFSGGMTMGKRMEKPVVDRRQLQQIIAGLSEGVILVDPDGSIVWANETALLVHGVTTLAELGATVREYGRRFILRYRNHHRLSKHQYPLARMIAGDQLRDVVVEVTRPDDEQFWRVHQFRSLVLTDAAGASESLALVIQDITGRISAEDRFERTFAANPAPALICRLSDLRYVKVNDGFLEMTGYTRDDVIGRPAYELDVLEGSEKREQAIERLNAGQTVPQTEATLRLSSGATKLVIVAGQPIEMADESCMLFTFMDLEPRRLAEAALRDSEARFSAAFRLAPVAMAVTRLEGLAFLAVNEAFVATTGFAAEDVLGRDAADVGLFARTGELNQLQGVLNAHGGASHEVEIQLVTAAGEKLECLMSGERASIQGQPCALWAIQDITERKRGEAELLAAMEAVMQDASWFSSRVMEKLAHIRHVPDAATVNATLADLTPREREMLARIAAGDDNGQIAGALNLAVNTVRNHIAALYSKIGVHRRGDAIVWARERGITGRAVQPRRKPAQSAVKKYKSTR